MALFKKFFNNCAKPLGFGGRLMLKMMNSGHVENSKWGFDHLHVKEEDRVLDIGCGGGANLAVFLTRCTKGKVIGMDYSPESVDMSLKLNSQAVEAKRCEVIQGDVMKLPFEAESFDIVSAFETIYFWPFLEEAFKGIHHILKTKGVFMICNDVAGSSEKWTKIIEEMKVYSDEALEAALKKAGFTKTDFYYNDKKNSLCIISIK